jgi:hypothetical protein
MRRLRWLVWSFGLTLAAAAVGCGIHVKRDLAAVPPGQVGFDDMCGLQGYFDALEIHTSPPPRLVSAIDLEAMKGDGGLPARGGKERFAFENDFQLKHLRRVLNENWKRLPEQIANANEIEIEVKWAEKAGTKRVITDEDAQLAAGAESWSLPYQPCLSDLLYGEPLYRQRRAMWRLPLPAVQASPVQSSPAPGRDGGATNALPAPDGVAVPPAVPPAVPSGG